VDVVNIKEIAHWFQYHTLMKEMANVQYMYFTTLLVHPLLQGAIQMWKQERILRALIMEQLVPAGLMTNGQVHSWSRTAAFFLIQLVKIRPT
jgi:hypothetical protein